MALDDLGTGDSLSYLDRFQFAKIKIDRSFRIGRSVRTDALSIVRATPALGADLGTTVAKVSQLGKAARDFDEFSQRQNAA